MHWFTITFFISSLTSLTAAISICSSGIYSKLAPLSTYKPAQSYCSAHFPVPTATVTSTVTVTQLAKRTALHGRNTPKKHTTANLSSCYSSLKGAVSSIAKTLCSCIETGATSTVMLYDQTQLCFTEVRAGHNHSHPELCRNFSTHHHWSQRLRLPRIL